MSFQLPENFTCYIIRCLQFLSHMAKMLATHPPLVCSIKWTPPSWNCFQDCCAGCQGAWCHQAWPWRAAKSGSYPCGIAFEQQGPTALLETICFRNFTAPPRSSSSSPSWPCMSGFRKILAVSWHGTCPHESILNELQCSQQHKQRFHRGHCWPSPSVPASPCIFALRSPKLW